MGWRDVLFVVGVTVSEEGFKLSKPFFDPAYKFALDDRVGDSHHLELGESEGNEALAVETMVCWMRGELQKIAARDSRCTN